MGAAIGLPVLEAMVPAMTALAQTPARPKTRFGAVFVPNGAIVDQWSPSAVGADFAFTPILQPLERFRDKLVVVSSLNSNMISIIDASFGAQTAIPVGSQPMDFAFGGDELFVGCQGDGTMHVLDIPNRRHKGSFKAGTGCESVGFY